MIGSLMSRMGEAQKLSVSQLQQAIQDGILPAYVGIPLLQEKLQQQKMAQVAAPSEQQAPIAEQVMQEANQSAGIDQLQSNKSAGLNQLQSNLPTKLASGGIIAFEEGGDVKHYARAGVVNQDKLKNNPLMHQDYKAILEKKVLEDMDRISSNDPFEKSSELSKQYMEEAKQKSEQDNYLAMMEAGLKMMGGTSPYAATNVGAGGQAGVEALMKSRAGQDANRKLLLSQQVEAEKAKNARDVQLAGLRQTSLGQLYGKDAAIAQAAATERLAGSNSALANEQKLSRLKIEANELFTKTAQGLATQIFAANKAKYKFNENDPQIQQDAAKEAWKRMSPDVQKIIGLGSVYGDTPAPGGNTPPPNPNSKPNPQVGGGNNTPAGLPPGSKIVGTSGGKNVWETPDGQRMIEK